MLTAPNLSRLGLFPRVAIYVLLCSLVLAAVSPLAQPSWETWTKFAVYRFGIAVWSAQVFILAAVLTLSVPSRLRAIQFVLLTALVQGYAYVALRGLWSGTRHSDFSDYHVRFAVVLGLSATFGAVLWLLYRIVFRIGLSDRAAQGTAGDRQFSLRELLDVTAILAVVFACAGLFAWQGVIPTEQVLFLTVVYAGEIGPSVYLPFWLAAYPRLGNWHWLWVVPLSVASLLVSMWSRHPESWFYGTAAFSAALLGNAITVAVNGVALHAVGLTWRQWVSDLGAAGGNDDR